MTARQPVNPSINQHIFRGLTIFTMVVVNEVAGGAEYPGQNKARTADADAMTFVDVVFPAIKYPWER